jgi:PAS domain S-box-containing protein
MNDSRKTKARLIEELAELRRQVEEMRRGGLPEVEGFLEIAGVMLIAIGADQKVRFINRVGCEILGYERDEIVGKNWFDHFLPARDREQVKSVFTMLMAGNIEQVEYFENFVLTRVGEERIIAWHNAMSRDENGEITGILSSGKDVTESKRAEVELRAKETFLDRVVNQSPFATWISDAEGTLQHANPALKKFLNLTDEQLVGKYNVLKDPLVERQGLVPLIRTVYEQGKSISFTCDWDGNDIPTMDLGDSNSVSIEATMFPIHNSEGELTNVVLNWIDITARQQAEAALREAHDELERQVEERTAELQVRNRELESFSYSVSHDLRAPLRAISGFAQILAQRHREELAERSRHYLDNIIDASEQMERLIQDLLTYSRLGRQTVRPQPMELREVLREVEQALGSRLQEKGIRIEVPDRLPLVRGTPTLLSQIFTNLLDNALTYVSREGIPEVELSFDVEPEKITVCVRDNGIGIPPEFHDKIFDIFQRLHGQDDYPGTGIGLAMVRKGADLLGGRVWVESAPDSGSRFFVELRRT